MLQTLIQKRTDGESAIEISDYVKFVEKCKEAKKSIELESSIILILMKESIENIQIRLFFLIKT